MQQIDKVAKLSNELDASLSDLVTNPENHNFKLSHISDITSNMQSPSWLIKKILEQDTITVIFGPAGAGKSFLVIDMCCHVSTGKDWHGHQVKQCPVIYIKGEGHNGFGRRVIAWGIKHNIDINDYQFFASETAAQFYSLESAIQVSEAIEEIIKPPNQEIMIVIDTLARNFGPANENSTEDMNQFIDHVDQFIRAKFNATVVIVHHTGVMNKDRGRGSSALNAALDFEYKIEQPQDKLIQLTCTKIKDFEPPPPMAFSMVQVDTGLIDEDGLPVNSVVLESTNAIIPVKTTGLGSKQKALLDLLQDMYKQHQDNLINSGYPAKDARVLVHDWKEQSLTTGLFPEKNHRQMFSKTKGALEKRKLISISGGYVLPRSEINA